MDETSGKTLLADRLVAGVDEVGRGCLAGPVIAAAVVLDPRNPVDELADSKKLSAIRRHRIAEDIRSKALYWSLGRSEASEIDRLNILNASLLAMARAVKGLGCSELEWVWVDGNQFPDIEYPGEAVVRGDQLIAEISAASIMAKVCRDAEMALLGRLCPGYGFSMNKGYPTRQHRASLLANGGTVFHRYSFKPVRELSSNGNSENGGRVPDSSQP